MFLQKSLLWSLHMTKICFVSEYNTDVRDEWWVWGRRRSFIGLAIENTKMIMYWYHLFLCFVVPVATFHIYLPVNSKFYLKKILFYLWILVLARDCFLQMLAQFFSYATIITINSFTTPFLLSGEMVFFCFFLCVLFGTVCF